MKNQLIIFSKNRANQLELLLNSILKNSNNIFDVINIIFKAEGEYKEAYEKLIAFPQYKDVNFYIERGFASNLNYLLKTDIEFTTFMVDDNVLYSQIPSTKDEILEKITDDVVCFSLRLGDNCIYSHPANLNYVLQSHSVINNMIEYNWLQQWPSDFRYPLSVDGHIFKTSFIVGLINKIQYHNPNTLEGNLQRQLNNIPNNIWCFKTSVLVGIPVNIVNDTHKNRNGLEYPISEKELNDKFLNNIIIDLENLNFENINGPHKEIQYVFKKN